MALLLIGILCLGIGVVFDRSRATLIFAVVASAALIAFPLLFFRPY